MSNLEVLQTKFKTHLLDEPKVAKALGISKKKLKALIMSGELQTVKIGEEHNVSISVLSAFMDGKKTTENYDKDVKDTGCVKVNPIELASEYVADDEDDTMKYTGSVSKLNDGRFMVQINKGKRPDGKRDRESKGFRDENEAITYLDRRLAELRQQDNEDVCTNEVISQAHKSELQTQEKHKYTNLTFEQYAMNLINEGVGKAKSRTNEGYRGSLFPVIKEIGRVKMVDVSREQLKDVFNKLSKNYVQSGIRKSFNTVKMIIELAYVADDIPKNVMLRMSCPDSCKASKKESRDAYSEDEVNQILQKAKGYNQILYPMFTLLECTGMRPQEMRALEWSSFDPNEKTIFIYQAVSKEFEKIKDMKKTPKSKEFISVTKTKYSKRTLRLSDLATNSLLEWKKVLENCDNRAMRESKYIFPSETGDFRSDTSFNQMVRRFKKNCGLQELDMSPYRFRHTLCSRLLKRKLSIKTVQRIMGDNTTKVIMEIYAHISEKEALEEARDYYDEQDLRLTELVEQTQDNGQ